MRIGLVPGGFKPYHAGHDALIRAASAENDRVIVFYSTADRSRKGELPISGKNAARVMSEIVSATLPINVTLCEVKAPIGAVFEALISAEDLHARSCADDTYTIYAGSDDEKNFANIAKYAPRIVKEGHVRLFSLERGSDTPEISGTLMRKSLREGNVHLFSEGLPSTLKPKAKEIIKTLGFKEDSVARVPRRRATESYTGTNTSKTFKNYSRSNLRDVVMVDFLSEVRRQNHRLLLEDTGGYDSWTTSPNLLVKTFVAPFVNAAKATKAMGLDFANIGSVPLRALVAKVRGSDTAFEDAMRGYKSSRAKIQKMWEPIEKYSDEALSGDAQILAFCFDPVGYSRIALTKTFLEVIGGKSGDASSGLIGTLAASGFLPDKWSEKWKDFKDDKDEDLDDEEDLKRRKSEYEKSRAKLKKDLGLLIAVVGGSSLADLDGRDKIKEKLEDILSKIEKGKTKDIGRRALGDTYERTSIISVLNSAIRQSESLGRNEKIRLRNALERITYNLSNVGEKSDSSRESDSNYGYKPLDLNRSEVVDASFRAAYRSLYSAFKSYAKSALFFAALEKSRNLQDLQRELRSAGVDCEAELSAFSKEIDEAVQKSGADKEKAYQTGVAKVKAEVAKGVAAQQEKMIAFIQKVQEDALGKSDPERAGKIIASSKEAQDLTKVLQFTEQSMNKLHAAIRSGGNPEGAAASIKKALAAMQKKAEG